MDVKPIEMKWPAAGKVVVTDIKTYGCGIGSEYVYCYSFPTFLEVARLKQERCYRVKVGKAEGDPITRIYQQVAGSKTALSEPPVVLIVFQTLASRHLEKWLHNRLERAVDAIGSEWFYTNPDELVELFREYVRAASSPVEDVPIQAAIEQKPRRLPTVTCRSIDGFAVFHEDGKPLSFPLQLVHLMWANMKEPITVEELRMRVAERLGVPPEAVPAKFDQQIAIELGTTGRKPRFQYDSANRLVLVPGQKMPRARTANLDGSQRFD
jgi:hypothetical protein